MSMNVELVPIKNNFNQVRIGGLTIWFSYRTPIAYQHSNDAKCVRVNDWSATTGKHLSQVDNGSQPAKDKRVAGEVFEERLASMIHQEHDKTAFGVPSLLTAARMAYTAIGCDLNIPECVEAVSSAAEKGGEKGPQSYLAGLKHRAYAGLAALGVKTI